MILFALHLSSWTVVDDKCGLYQILIIFTFIDSDIVVSGNGSSIKEDSTICPDGCVSLYLNVFAVG